jgi:quinol monooxygenase YgiN
MAYALTAKWTAKAGEEERVLAAIEQLVPATLAEPGCLVYRASRSVDDPRVFLLYEEYVDEDAYAAHGATEHFQRLAAGEAIPLLESRERAFYRTLEY